jgi:hypothetical protein
MRTGHPGRSAPFASERACSRPNASARYSVPESGSITPVPVTPYPSSCAHRLESCPTSTCQRTSPFGVKETTFPADVAAKKAPPENNTCPVTRPTSGSTKLLVIDAGSTGAAPHRSTLLPQPDHDGAGAPAPLAEAHATRNPASIGRQTAPLTVNSVPAGHAAGRRHGWSGHGRRAGQVPAWRRAAGRAVFARGRVGTTAVSNRSLA